MPQSAVARVTPAHARPSEPRPGAARRARDTGVCLALVAAGVATTGAGSAAAQDAPGSRSYTVRSGDTVSAIALRTGSSVGAIVRVNGLNSRAFIRAGQSLTIPAPSAVAAPSAAPAAGTVDAGQPASTATTYTVVAGDTVSAIARRFGTTVAAVVAANGLDARAFIRAGQQLVVPGSAAVSAAPAAPGVRDATVTTVANPVVTPLVPSTFAGRTYPGTTVAAANANKALLLAADVPSKDAMRELVARTADAMGVDRALALAVARQESGFDQRAVSPANAIGTMQVIPSSGEWASQLVGRDLNLLDPQDNVVAGVAILRALVRSARDLPTAIAGYYQGQASVRKYGMFADTRRYVANVRTLMTQYR